MMSNIAILQTSSVSNTVQDTNIDCLSTTTVTAHLTVWQLVMMKISFIIICYYYIIVI